MEAKIDSKRLEENICILKNDINEVNVILDNISKSVNKIPEVWKSNKEEEIMDSLRQSIDKFEDLSKLNKKYEELLDLIDKKEYEALDKKLNELMCDETGIN